MVCSLAGNGKSYLPALRCRMFAAVARNIRKVSGTWKAYCTYVQAFGRPMNHQQGANHRVYFLRVAGELVQPEEVVQWCWEAVILWYLEILFSASTNWHWIGRHPRPTLLLWGERDGLNPPQTVGHKAPFMSVILDGLARITQRCGVWKCKLGYQTINTQGRNCHTFRAARWHHRHFLWLVCRLQVFSPTQSCWLYLKLATLQYASSL